MQQMKWRSQSRSTRSRSRQPKRSRAVQIPPARLHPPDRLPSRDDSIQLTEPVWLASGEIGIDELENPLGGVGSWREVEAEGLKVGCDSGSGAAVTDVSFGEEVHRVELVECRGGRLVDGCDDHQLNVSTVLRPLMPPKQEDLRCSSSRRS